MIYLFTDFSLNGPYVGQMKSVLYSVASNCTIIDLMHDAPAFKPKASSYLLAALATYIPQGAIVIAVVDPGVGNPGRRPVMVQADGRWYVGPDNGLFHYITKHAKSRKCYEIIVEENISKSFHGRDVFAPAAGKLVTNMLPNSRLISPDSMLMTEWRDDLTEIIYIDEYGNAMTGIRADSISIEAQLTIKGVGLNYADTFSSVAQGEVFWYENSIGLIEISRNCGNAAEHLGLCVGTTFSLHT